MRLKRSCGILLHPTSLPGRHGIGALGMEAYRFIDFLAENHQSYWQILPLGPTGFGDSPYSAFSAFAGNPLMICLERLVEQGDLSPDDLENTNATEGIAHFGLVQGFKGRLLRKAAAAFQRRESAERHEAFDRFCRMQAYWLEDYALFKALRDHLQGAAWNSWPQALRNREQRALDLWRQELAEQVHYQRYSQFVFFEQWFALKQYANQKGIKIIGDIPIFVAFDSADVWANAKLFHLDSEQNPTLVAGVPPDYFSATGQRWGNPLYDWEQMHRQDFSWWMARFRWNLEQTDMVRVDHFRGFESFWAIPAEEKTAINGHWRPAAGRELFQALRSGLGEVPVIAEDLGVITPQVESLRDEFGFPGMKILQFAFGSGPDNPYLPHNLIRHCVAYTGTHDNNTTLGWWKGLNTPDREAVRDYLGVSGRDMPWDLIRSAMASVADLCILPLQDILGLGAEARMNTPGTASGNWSWRYLPGALDDPRLRRLKEMTETYGRAPKGKS